MGGQAAEGLSLVAEALAAVDKTRERCHTFVTRKVREGLDYKQIMAITSHRAFATFQRYNNPTEEDVKAVVLANPPKKMVG